MRELSETMATDWALRYFGDWHSHHKLGLMAPSGGDRRRITNIAGRNQFTNMAEIIVTLDDNRDEPIVRIHPWIYDLSSKQDSPVPLRIRVLPGLSPIRQALLARKSLPEQDFNAWGKIPLHRIRIGNETPPPVVEPASDVDSTTREKILAQLAEALQRASNDVVEHHVTGFGVILVAKISEPYYFAVALASAWPMPVLEAHRLNRSDGSTESIDAPANLTALDIGGILGAYRKVEAAMKGTANVDK